MTELPQHRVHIRADDGTRKTFIVDPTPGDVKRASIALSAEDRNARPKWDFDKAHGE